MTQFLIFGHRGSPARFPENTIESFEETLRAGADGFETDLRLLSDDEAVLFHDDELADAAIESLTLADCQHRGVRVARVRDLARFAGRCTMILEVKRAGWDTRLLSDVGTWPGVIVASFDHTLLAALAARGAPCELGATILGSIAGVDDYLASLRVTWCFPSFRHVTSDVVAALHRRSIRVVPWTPNREAEWEALRSIGCDGIITDQPAAAVLWRQANSAFPQSSE